MHKQKSFTLVEIMIVVAIVALLFAIAIPNLLRARIHANESVAITSVRTVSTAMEGFRGVNRAYTGATLAVLSAGPLPYIDNVLGNGAKQGYTFTLTIVGSNQYWFQGVPNIQGATGVRSFYIDEQGVVCAGANPAAGHSVAGNSCPVGFNPVE